MVGIFAYRKAQQENMNTEVITASCKSESGISMAILQR